MKTLKSFDFGPDGGDRSRYDWDKLLDGGIHQLKEGEDYTGKHFLNRVKVMAKKREMKVRGKKVEGGLVIQAYKGE
jgi:hypothetical protein